MIEPTFGHEIRISSVSNGGLNMNSDNSDKLPEMRTPSIKGDVTERIAKVSRFFADAIVRNMPTETRGSGCPVIVEGRRDASALREIGFSGEIEVLNRGWDKSRFVAYIYDNYGIRNLVDQGPSVILLMDWDRTGMKLQSTLSTRFGALDVKVDEGLWRSLVKNMKSEGKTVESLRAHAITLREMISDQLFPHSLE